jgi:hypothetical protein
MSKELMDVLGQVITSWQVLSVTGVLVLYFLLVTHVARGHRRPGGRARTIPAARAKDRAAPAGEPDLETPEGNDLGLTEE